MNLSPQLLANAEAHRATWAALGGLRAPEALARADALAVVEALREVPHTFFDSRPPQMGALYCRASLSFEQDGVLGEVARLCAHSLRAWLASVSGLPLGPPLDGSVAATYYGRGHFLDPHNDFDGRRAVAVVLGLTEGSWPREEGGWLEFLAVEQGAVRVVEARRPGLGTLDAFDVRGQGALHRVPQLLGHRERRALTLWYPLDEAESDSRS